MAPRSIILGAGVTGLGAALSSRLTVYEGASRPGGVCHSYYRSIDGSPQDPLLDDVSECFRFEPGGGHWLFGVSGEAFEALRAFGTFRTYVRRAATFFPQERRFIPYPLQDNLRYLDPKLRDRILTEICAAQPRAVAGCLSFKEWLLMCFGPSLCDLFFFPFNDRYTCGYLEHIAPQDGYKSAIDRGRVLQGAFEPTADAGYNRAFHYPEGGLDRLIRAISAGCDIQLEHRVISIDTLKHIVRFSNGQGVTYDKIISTIPLDSMLRLCGITGRTRPDPATAVLVVNIAARKGIDCPSYHWVYVPSSKSGIHRVGFYSNVDQSFLPAQHRSCDDLVSVYAERSYVAGNMPSEMELDDAARAIVDELKEWGFISDVLVVDRSFTDPAYTWSWQRSVWAKEAIQLLAGLGIRQIGRYGAWKFQGMLASFGEGFATGKNCDL
jgi:protoporphyrinogen oxidase